MYLFSSAKGGSGVTVVSAAVALQLSKHHGRCVLVDLCGDVPGALGMAEPTGPGINEWLSAGSTANADSLLLGATAVDDAVLVVHRGADTIDGAARWVELAAALSSLPMPVVVDAGTLSLGDAMYEHARRHVMVTRPCYLALRRALTARKPHGVVVLVESGRALTPKDVASVLGVPVDAEIPVDAAVARALDAGLFTSRVPQLLERYLPNFEN